MRRSVPVLKAALFRASRHALHQSLHQYCMRRPRAILPSAPGAAVFDLPPNRPSRPAGICCAVQRNHRCRAYRDSFAARRTIALRRVCGLCAKRRGLRCSPRFMLTRSVPGGIRTEPTHKRAVDRSTPKKGQSGLLTDSNKYPPAVPGVFLMRAKPYVTSRASCGVGTV